MCWIHSPILLSSKHFVISSMIVGSYSHHQRPKLVTKGPKINTKYEKLEKHIKKRTLNFFKFMKTPRGNIKFKGELWISSPSIRKIKNVLEYKYSVCPDRFSYINFLPTVPMVLEKLLFLFYVFVLSYCCYSKIIPVDASRMFSWSPKGRTHYLSHVWGLRNIDYVFDKLKLILYMPLRVMAVIRGILITYTVIQSVHLCMVGLLVLNGCWSLNTSTKNDPWHNFL